MSLSWVLQHMEQRCYLDRSPCIKCLFFLTLACTLEDTVYQTACRKSSSNSESPRLQYICKPRYLKITHRSMIGKITVKTRHQPSSTKEINGPWCASTRRHGREQEGGNYNLYAKQLPHQDCYIRVKWPIWSCSGISNYMVYNSRIHWNNQLLCQSKYVFFYNQWHHTRIQDTWFENKEYSLTKNTTTHE